TEWIEDKRQKVCRNSLAGVAYNDLYARADTQELYPYLSATGRELDSVGQEIPYHLLKAIPIARSHPGVLVELHLEFYLLLFSKWAHYLYRSVDDFRKFHRHEGKTHFTRETARYIQKIIDQLRLHSCISFDAVEGAVDIDVLRGFAAKHRHPSQDRGEGRSQFVRNHRQKAVLRLCRGFHLFSRSLFSS